MRNNIANRVYRLEVSAPDEDNTAFLERLHRARARLREEGYDLHAKRSDPATVSRADALKKIFEKSRRSPARQH